MYQDISSINDYVTDISAIKNSLKNILLTPKGSLPGQPNFGSNIYKIMFDNINTLTKTILKNVSIEAIREFDKRILVKDIIITQVEEFNKIILEIFYKYKDTRFSSDEINDSVKVAITL